MPTAPNAGPSIPDPNDRASALIRQALTERKEHLSGSAQIPAIDSQLSERILGEARRRSAALSASQAGTSKRLAPAQHIPWWLWLAWATAILAVGLAFKFVL